MGSTLLSHTMVATKVLISLCVVTLASAQNQQVIVNDVVTALQPTIARAVADALRGLGGSSSGSRFSSGSSRFSSSSSGGSTGFASGSRGSSSFGASGSSSFGASGAAGAAAGAEPTARPEYNYEFKVADEQEQTFISANEARDGDDVVGTYSYVDPNGDLITVNYRAGLDGYTQTLDKQEGAVQMRTTSSSQSGSTGFAAGQNSFQSSRGQSARGSSSRGQSTRGSSRGQTTSFKSISSSGSLDQSALISKILAVLQPQITSAVNTAVSQQSRF